MADAWAVSNWETASSMIAVGLSWKEAIGACVLGNTLMAIVITVNGRIGATVSTSNSLELPGRSTAEQHSFTRHSPFSPGCHSATTSPTSWSFLAVFSRQCGLVFKRLLVGSAWSSCLALSGPATKTFPTTFLPTRELRLEA